MTIHRWLLVIVIVLSCRESELPVSVQKASDLQVPDLHDPDQLPNILGAKGAYLEEKFPGATKSIVPKVDINLRDGRTNFYEIQRCPKGARLKTAANKDPLDDEYDESAEEQKVKDYHYVWGMATAGVCTLLDGKHTSVPFVDDFNTEKIGGANFDFFYLVRPCLFAGNSIYRGRKICSRVFARTNPIEGYINNVAKENLELRAKLSAQRVRLEHRMMQMASVIRQKAHYLKQCEFKEAKKNAFRRRLAGIAKVALTATGVVAGAILSGGTAAFLAGSAAAQLGDKLFSGISNATLNCPTGVYDQKNEALLADVNDTIKNIGEIRSSLGELKLDGTTSPSAEQPLQALSEECEAVDLGKDCTGGAT